ncbi:hypothetical protein PPUJ20066_00280 [Pseudomonas putida]|nr:hypothetical protein PPUJ20066_00280 [Pseudomonas putida]
MEKQPDVRRLFYQGQQLVTQIKGKASQTLLFAGGVFLSESQGISGHCIPRLVTTDLNGSVIGVVRGDVVVQSTYTAYGYRPEVNAMFLAPGFTGAILEPVASSYMLGNGVRAYNTRSMRFSGADSLSPFFEGGINSYAYCAGDPINYSDPTGRRRGVVQAQAQRDHRLERVQRRNVLLQERDLSVRAYKVASNNIKLTIDNGLLKAGWKLDALGELPQGHGDRGILRQQALKEVSGLFTRASNMQIEFRLSAFTGAVFQSKTISPDRKRTLLGLGKVAADQALFNNRVEAIRGAEILWLREPPPLPGSGSIGEF